MNYRTNINLTDALVKTYEQQFIPVNFAITGVLVILHKEVTVKLVNRGTFVTVEFLNPEQKKDKKTSGKISCRKNEHNLGTCFLLAYKTKT